MKHREPHAQHLFCLQKMPDISPGIPAAGRTFTALFYGTEIPLILLVEQIQLSLMGIDVSVAAVPGGIDTVKEVDAPFHAFQDIFRRADAHQIGGFVLRKIRHRFVQDVIHLFMGFSDGKAADGRLQ